MRRLLSPLFLFLAVSAFGSTYVVNDLGDATDTVPGNDACATAGGVCTLRAAIAEANAHTGPDGITFSVAGAISPATALPVIAGPLTIDGTSAPGYAGTPLLIVGGGGAIPNGLVFTAGAPGSALHAVKVHGFTNAAVVVEGAGIAISRNHIGPVGGGIANGIGISLNLTASAAMIGGNSDGLGNVISGNTGRGISISSGSSHTIADNYIGTNAAGTAALPNGGNGIHVTNASGVVIGGQSPGTENVISGNSSGVVITGGNSNTVAGNLIGLDATGTFAVANGGSGVSVSGATNSAIGTGGVRNVLSGNGTGIVVVGGSTIIVNNIIGLNAAGTAAVPNGDGISAGAGTTIGTPASGNVISGNAQHGIRAGGAVLIQNNIVGLDPTGTVSRGNGLNGIQVVGPNPVIGGDSATDLGNVISGNGNDGISCTSTTGLRILGNTIGLTADRTAARPNLGNGITVTLNSFDVRIGSAGWG